MFGWKLKISSVCASALFALSPSSKAQTPQPPCQPPTPAVINYLGASTGCSNQVGGNRACLVGEIIQFKFGSGLPDCSTTYYWVIEGIHFLGPPTTSYQFWDPGIHRVDVLVQVVTSNTAIWFTQNVMILSAAEIPVMGNFATSVLLISIALLALHRLR